MALSPSYYKNLFCGNTCSQDKMDHIPLARLELTQHVTLKATQAFGAIGSCVIAPVMSLLKCERESRMQDIQQRAFLYGKRGILTGLVVGPLITAAFLPGKSYDGIHDRCYRIRCNKTQLRADKFSLIGVAVGMGACHFVGEQLSKGAVFGYIGGFLFATSLNVLF